MKKVMEKNWKTTPLEEKSNGVTVSRLDGVIIPQRGQGEYCWVPKSWIKSVKYIGDVIEVIIHKGFGIKYGQFGAKGTGKLPQETINSYLGKGTAEEVVIIWATNTDEELIIKYGDAERVENKCVRPALLQEVGQKKGGALTEVYMCNSLSQFLLIREKALYPPLRNEKLKTYLKEKNINYKSEYEIERCSEEGYKLPLINDLNPDELSYFTKGFNLNKRDIPKCTPYRQFSLMDKQNTSIDNICKIIRDAEESKSAEKFIKNWWEKCSPTIYIDAIDFNDELMNFQQDPQRWLINKQYKVDKFEKPEILLVKYLKHHGISVKLTKVKDRLFQYNTPHIRKSYFCNFTEGQKGSTHNEAREVYRRMIELSKENPDQHHIFIIADYQPKSGEDVLSFINRTKLKGIKGVEDMENTNWEVIPIESWIATKM